MNTTVVGAILQVAFDRLVPHTDFLQFLRQVKSQLKVDVNAEVEKLKRNSRIVIGVLHDAEQKQIRNPAVDDWLGELKHLAYDIEDLLDNLATDVKAWKLEKESKTHSSQVQSIISPILHFWSEHKQVDQIKTLTLRFDEITKQSHDLGLIHGVRESSMGVEQRDLTTSIVNESFIYGRDNDVEWILQQILSANQNTISVIPIVGMGGVGKTTIAQLVYNHEKLEHHFNLKVWVCISNVFDLPRTTKAILESITGQSPDQKELQSLQTNLRHQLKDQKFLLVLDDVWTEKPSDWDRLQAPFETAANGSCIVLTTRSEKVSAIMRTVDNYSLGNLSDADCQRLFYQQAFVDGNADSHPKLQEIGDKIVKKCKGLPLAAKTLGALLRCNLDITEWKRVLNDDIWDLPESDIIPSLRLSYYYLPSHLKRCFAYSAMFPQDYKFKKDELILLWMAEGFLRPQCNKRMEDVGDQYFGELLSRSFFQKSLNIFGDPVFVMHDLIHDLAKSISQEICLNIGDGIKVDESWKNDKSSVRHILVPHAYEFKVMSRFGDARSIRSLLFQSDDAFFYVSKQFLYDVVPNLRCLRVLFLENCKNIKELPESIGKLKGLRYLNLSTTQIKRLPKSVSTLYNLQTLKFSGYKSTIVQLPNDIGNLTDLRHLLIDKRFHLKKMPLGIGKLTNLQSLPTFVVGKHDEPNIEELRDMQQLREDLSIERLENVVDAWEATQAKLGSKEHLRALNLEWTYRRDGIDSRDEEDVIQALQPHTNIRELSIQRYGGKRLPNWLGCSSYSMLETLKLLYCGNCACLPRLGCLQFLKRLVLYGLHGVKKLGPEFYGDVCVVKPFESLESLIVRDMEGLEEWSGIEQGFPHLLQLEIHNCPSLSEFSCRFPQLKELKISDCANLKSLPRCLTTLQKLEIKGCHEIILSSVVEPPPPLTRLCIFGIANLKHLPLEEGIIWECLTTLQELEIHKCNELVTLMPSLSHMIEGLQRLESLQRLEINFCTELVCLTEVDEDKLPPKLENLTIVDCHKLQKLPHGAHNVTFFGDITIEDCPNLVVSLVDVAPFSSLRNLRIYGCQKLELPEEVMLPSMLKELEIVSCGGFETLPLKLMHNAICLEELSLRCCSSFALFPEEMELPSTLKVVRISECENVKTLPDGMMRRDNEANNNDSFLDRLEIQFCDSLTSFTTRASSSSRLPFLPKNIHIYSCPELVAVPVVMLHDNKFLETLEIACCDSLESFGRITIVSNVKRINMSNCKNLESLPCGMDKLTSLQSLTVKGCHHLASFPDGGLPRSLQSLLIERCDRLNPFPKDGFPGSLTSLTIMSCKEQNPMSEWGIHKLASLRSLSIGGFSGCISFSVRLLPPNLTHLCIQKLPDLQLIPEGLGSLTSLEILEIKECDKLVPFLETGLPPSISELRVSGCPALEGWCAKETEKDGSNMATIFMPHLKCTLYKFFR